MTGLKDYEYAFFEIYKGRDKENLQSCFRSIVGNLDESFQSLVTAYETLGHNDYGIEGLFSEERHVFMDVLEELENDIINTELEILKVQEMKLVHRKTEKYKDKINKSLARILELADENDIDVASSIGKYAEYIDLYYKQFNEIGLSDEEGLRLDLKNKLVEADIFFLKIADDSNSSMIKASKDKTVFRSDLYYFRCSRIINCLLFVFKDNYRSVIHACSCSKKNSGW